MNLKISCVLIAFAIACFSVAAQEVLTAVPEIAEEALERGWATTSLVPEVWQYEYKGELVYYVPVSSTRCCDQLSQLFNQEGEVICRPDGGYSGRGDERCPDFFSARSGGVLVRARPPSATESDVTAESPD